MNKYFIQIERIASKLIEQSIEGENGVFWNTHFPIKTDKGSEWELKATKSLYNGELWHCFVFFGTIQY